MVLSEHSVAIPKSISWSSFYLLKFQRHPHYIFSFFSGSLKSKEVLRLCESNGWVGFWWLVSTIISTTLYILMGWWYRYLIIDTYLLLRITHRLNSIHLTHDSNFSGSSTTSIWDSKDWLHHSNHVLLPENSQKSDSNGQFTRNFNFMHLFKGLGVFVFPPWACRFTKKKPIRRWRNQVWMCILEKAIAKIQGNYQQLNGGLVSDGWKIMCGASDTDIENWEAGWSDSFFLTVSWDYSGVQWNHEVLWEYS